MDIFLVTVKKKYGSGSNIHVYKVKKHWVFVSLWIKGTRL